MQEVRQDLEVMPSAMPQENRLRLFLMIMSGVLFVGTMLASSAGGIRGVVRDTEGTALAGAAVEVVSLEDPDQRYTSHTLKNGQYILIGIQPGKYKVSAAKDGYIPFERAFLEVEVTDAEVPVITDLILEKVQSDDSLDVLADAKKGAALLKEGRVDEAIVILEQALLTNPEVGAVHYNLGVAYQKKEEIEKARERYRDAIKVQPDLGEAYLALGSSYLAERDSDVLAIEALEKASELMPESYPAFYNLGVSYANAGKYSDAESAFRRATEIHPKEPIAHYQMGLALLGQSKNEAAIEAFQKYLELNPNAADRKEVEDLIQTLK